MKKLLCHCVRVWYVGIKEEENVCCWFTREKKYILKKQPKKSKKVSKGLIVIQFYMIY